LSTQSHKKQLAIAKINAFATFVGTLAFAPKFFGSTAKLPSRILRPVKHQMSISISKLSIHEQY